MNEGYMGISHGVWDIHGAGDETWVISNGFTGV